MSFLGWVAIIALVLFSIFTGAMCVVAIGDWWERRKRK